ncbi:MAG: hypothetical protein KA756_08850, partial [Steroidobacteraceae bacterium]|nr:hypothetical protein [Steroidobacteraceae bacterium]
MPREAKIDGPHSNEDIRGRNRRRFDKTLRYATQDGLGAIDDPDAPPSDVVALRLLHCAGAPKQEVETSKRLTVLGAIACGRAADRHTLRIPAPLVQGFSVQA